MREPPAIGAVRLRHWRADDLESLLRHADDAAVSRGLGTRFPYPYTRADGEAFLSGRVLDLSGPVFALEIDGEACGGIGVQQGSGERRHGATLGYWLGRRHWGQGIMTTVVMTGNPASARVLLKTGFIEEGLERQAVFKDGVLHDMRCFARLRAWPPGS